LQLTGDIQVAARPGSGQQDEGAAASAAKDVTSNMSHIKRSLHTTSTAMGESYISIVMSESCISIVMSESCISIVMSESCISL